MSRKMCTMPDCYRQPLDNDPMCEKHTLTKSENAGQTETKTLTLDEIKVLIRKSRSTRASVRFLLHALESSEKMMRRLKRENEDLLKLSENLDEHPDDYDGPCWCATCRSYADT